MITITAISKSYGPEQVLKEVSVSMKEKSTLSILGSSGSGKSTLLKILAGLEPADSGNFRIGDREMLTIPPPQRGVVYLSQEPLLFPHLNVEDNLGYGLRLRHRPSREIKDRVYELAERIGLTRHLDKQPEKLSGGQKQRVSFGRALIINPEVFLLDEPFSGLDSDTRTEMQELYRQMRDTYSITSVFVTHDLKEALIMGNQVATLVGGTLTHYGTIGEFLRSPGSGAQNELEFWRRIAGE